MDGTVLLADDDRTIRTVLTQAFTRAGCRVHATSSLTTLLRWVEEGKGDLVVTDVIMPDGNGIEMLPRIHQLRPDMPVIVISAQNTIMTAIQATAAKAWDYLPKPFDLPDLLARARKALAERRGRAAPRAAPAVEATSAPALELIEPADPKALPMVGRAPAMQALYRLVARVVNASIPIVIMGEVGTGKSMLARAVHDLSARREEPFVLITPDALASAEGMRALMAKARRGSLVFDKIGDLTQDAQARLIHSLDAAPADAPRVIALAEQGLMEKVAAGTFRHDLYFRLAGVVLTLPPLRERLEDIPLLAEHFMERAVRAGGQRRGFSAQALLRLKQHPWPGNVRELENVIQRLSITGTEPQIGGDELERALGESPPLAPARARTSAAGASLAEAAEGHITRYFELHAPGLPPAGIYERVLREVEAPLFKIALKACGGNQMRAADLLGINRNTLRKKLQMLEIRVQRSRKLA